MENQTSKWKTWHKVVLGIIGFFLSMIMIGMCSDGDTNQKTTIEQDLDSTIVEDVEIENWEYSEETDEMDGGKSFFAANQSTNKAEFQFPYDGGSFMTIYLRNTENRNSVALTLTKGQFMTSFSGNEKILKIKFDDAESVSYAYTTITNDGSNNVAFISNASRFISQIKKAKKVKIQVDIYQEGAPVFEFDVDKLEWKH